MATIAEIRSQIRSGSLSPIYALHGAEGYYIDELVKAFEALVPEEERDFNLYVLYAPEHEPEDVAEVCMRYPMMAERQVVILKEAQSVAASWLDGLASYAAHPNPSTVLVIASRGEKLKGRALTKALTASKAVMFESQALKDAQVAPTISTFIKDAGLSVEPKALIMMRDFVGSDLSRLYNEVQKITVALPKGACVTPEVVERLIGVSKDFNNFELVDAICRRDVGAAFRIVEYFRSNPKPNPPQVTVVTLFNFFSKQLMAWYAPDRSDRGLGEATGARWPKALEQVKLGMRNFNARQTIAAISAIRRFDTRSKGIGSRADQFDLLRELIFTILN